MAGDQSNDARRDFEAKVIDKAARDAAFRDDLLRDPKAAIEREWSVVTGKTVQFPAHVKVVVHQETTDRFHLVLPPVPDAAEASLSDAELAGVAGGAMGAVSALQWPKCVAVTALDC